MKRRSIFKIAALVIGVPLLLLAIVLFYLNFADLSGWRDTVAGLASDAIGRELRINGEFQPEIGFTTRVIAADITLANTDWSDDPHMLSVDRLAGEIDLLSVIFGPITIGNVEIDGARVLFETDADGRFNWVLGGGEPSEEPAGEFEMVIGHALVTDLQLVYAGPQNEPLHADLSKLEFTDDGSGMLDLELAGDFGETPIEISGRLGTFVGLVNASRVEHDLEGRFADASFSLRGTIDELAAISGVSAEVSLAGPDLSQITTAFGLETVIEDPFAAELSMRPAGDNSSFDIEASVGVMNAKLTGTVDSLTDPGELDVTVDASGPDVARIGELAGVDNLPTGPFNVSGRVQWAGFPLICENVKARVGDNTLSAHGILGKPPLMEGTDFTFAGGGPDISAIAALAGLEVPKDRFAVDGRLVRLDDGIDVQKIKLEIGGITVEADGTVGDPPGYVGTALTFRSEGPSLARLDHFVGIALPAEPFSINGGLAQGNGAIDLDNVRARLGRTVLQLDGQLSTADNFVGTDLRLQAQGPDASQAAALASLSTVPPEPFRIEGRARVLANGYRVDKLSGSLGSMNLSVDGFIGQPPALLGSDIQIHLDDSDLAHPASIAGITGLPHDPIKVDARIRVEKSGYRVTGLDATVAGVNARVDGFVGTPPDLVGTDLQIDGRGPRFDALGPYLELAGLPNAPFSVSGNARIVENGYALDGVMVKIDGNQLTVDGSVSPVERLAGTELEIELVSPDLRRAGRLARGFAEIPELPEQPLTLTTLLSIDESGYLIEDLQAAMGESRIVIDGRIGQPPEFLGTDLTIDGNEPDAALFGALADLADPPTPLQINGRIERSEIGFRFHGMTARLGDYRAAVDGTLGALPKLIGTDLEIHASGPGTALIKDLVAVPGLPNKPFTLDGEFSGTPERFSTREFSLTFGPSDIEGSFTVDIVGKADLQARLISSVIDLSHLRERLEEPEQDPDRDSEQKSPPADKSALVIPDKPFDLEWLNRVDADVTIRVDRLITPAKVFRDFKLDFDLERGRLEINRLAAVGQGEERMDGDLILEPDGNGYHLHTDISMRQIRLDIADSEIERTAQPPIDIDIDLESFGATPHELASSADGVMKLVIGKGVLDTGIVDLITADILLTLLNAFNPFAKQDVATELQCGVALLSITDGDSRLEPMAFQSDKMTMLGKGKIDFKTEKLNLEWITKPRKGIGISASMLTNPYIRLGGTLSDPSVQLKEAEAVVSTGAAVATMGLSLVAKGMLDRVTAEKKVCKKALEEIESLSHGSSK